MDLRWRVRVATVAVIVVVLVLSGPLVGLVDLTPAEQPAEVGDGNATVTVVSDPAADLRFDRGRFGTNVSYLRIPPAVVDVKAVSDRPRLVYVVRVPALDYRGSDAELLTDGGRTRVRISHRAFERGQVTNDSYRATVTIRVQSFAVDRTVYERNVTVPVQR